MPRLSGSAVAAAQRDVDHAETRLFDAIARGDAAAGTQALADWIDGRAFIKVYLEMTSGDTTTMH